MARIREGFVACHVGEVRLLRVEQAPGILIDRPLHAGHKAAHRVDDPFFLLEQVVFLLPQLGQVEGIGLAGEPFEHGDGRGEGVQKGIAGGLGLQLDQLVVQPEEGGGGLLAQRPGFAGLPGGRPVEELGVELLEVPHLGRGEVDLRGQHQVGEALGVAQRPGQRLAFQNVGVLAHLDLAPGAEPGQRALDGGQVPAVGLALEAVGQPLHGRAQPAPVVALHEGQHLALGLAGGGGFAVQQRTPEGSGSWRCRSRCRRSRAACAGWGRRASAARGSRARSAIWRRCRAPPRRRRR